MIKYNNKRHIINFIRDMKSKKAITLITYGDSWTNGLQQTDNPWGYQLRDKLQLLNPNLTYVHSGVGGWQASDGVTNLQTKVLDYNPDYVILNFGINDWTQKISIATYKENMLSIIQSLKNVNCTIFIWTTGPISTLENTLGYASPVNTASYTYILDDYFVELKNLCIQENLMFIDVQKVFLNMQSGGVDLSKWLYNAAHFTTPGHEIMYKVIISSLGITI